MKFAKLIDSWTPEENPLVESLLPIKRISIKNYLINSINPYTYNELLEKKREDFFLKNGGEEGLRNSYIKNLERQKTDPVLMKHIQELELRHEEYSEEGFKRYKDYKFKLYCNGGKRHGPIRRTTEDSYDYTSQKYAIELLEQFSQYRQIVSIAHYDSEDSNKLLIRVEFLDYLDVSRYQVNYEFTDSLINNDILNVANINIIEKITKVPTLAINDLPRILPYSESIVFFPVGQDTSEKVYCKSVYEQFSDKTGRQFTISITDNAFVVVDNRKRLYRGLPLFDIIRPYLENADFSDCTDDLLTDYEKVETNRSHNCNGTAPNRLKHFCGKLPKEIQFQICGCNREDPAHYVYNVYDININLQREIRVTIAKNNNDTFYWDEPKEHYDPDLDY